MADVTNMNCVRDEDTNVSATVPFRYVEICIGSDIGHW